MTGRPLDAVSGRSKHLLHPAYLPHPLVGPVQAAMFQKHFLPTGAWRWKVSIWPCRVECHDAAQNRLIVVHPRAYIPFPFKFLDHVTA